MTIASEITRIKNNIASAYTALSDKGATMPATQDSANLANCVDSISQSVTTSTLYTSGYLTCENNYALASTGNGIFDFDYNVHISPAQWQKELIIQLHIKTPVNLSNQWMISNGSDWNTGVGMTINSDLSGAFWCCLGQTDTTKAVTFSGSTIPQTQTEYWIRIYKPNTENEAHNTLFQISTDGVTWTTEDSVAIANITNDYTTDGTIRLFNMGNAGWSGQFEGWIYFSDTFISVDGEKVWHFF